VKEQHLQLFCRESQDPSDFGLDSRRAQVESAPLVWQLTSGFIQTTFARFNSLAECDSSTKGLVSI
jgi:hypothetical protein